MSLTTDYEIRTHKNSHAFAVISNNVSRCQVDLILNERAQKIKEEKEEAKNKMMIILRPT